MPIYYDALFFTSSLDNCSCVLKHYYIYTTEYNDLGMSNFPEADLYGPENLMGRFGKVCLLPQKILSDMFFFV